MRVFLNPALVRGVLQRVARGEIVYVNGVLRHCGDVLSPVALSLLNALHCHGYVSLLPGSSVVVLSVDGRPLLGWSNHQPRAQRLPTGVTSEDSGSVAEAAGEAAAPGARA